MCKLLVGIQNQYNPEFERIFRMQAEDVCHMKDGLGGFNLDKENNVQVCREVTDYKNVFQTLWGEGKMKDTRLLGLHGRQATTGEVTERNVHFFRHGNYLFAHNGIVSKMSGSTGNYGFTSTTRQGEAGTAEDTVVQKEHAQKQHNPYEEELTEEEKEQEEYELLTDILQDCNWCEWVRGKFCKKHEKIGAQCEVLEQKQFERQGYIGSEPPATGQKQLPAATNYLNQAKKERTCDSLRFLKTLPKENIKPKTLAKAIDTHWFTGVGLLFNTESKQGLVFGTRDIEVQTDLQSYMFLYSFQPEKELKVMKEYAGMYFPIEDKEIPTYSFGKGIYEFAVEDKSVRFGNQTSL